jgi:uncharacterized protein YjbI with pentapeptide repeats
MEKKLKDFLDEAFEPYGDFPARTEVINELLTHLTDKYNDLKAQGKSDDEAYQMTIGTFGDVKEIMENVPGAPVHDAPQAEAAEPEKDSMDLRKTLKQALKQAKASMGMSRFGAVSMPQSDLTDSQLADENFSYSALAGTKFDRSNLGGATFAASDLRDTSYVDADLAKATLSACDLHNANFSGANLAGTKFRACDLKDVKLKASKLTGTVFQHCDLGELNFDGQELTNVSFSASSLKKTSFKQVVLTNVSFHHSDVKHTIFDGATMDKVTYALLKGAGAKLDNVNVVAA